MTPMPAKNAIARTLGMAAIGGTHTCRRPALAITNSRPLAAGSTRGLACTKQALHSAWGRSFEAALDHERDLQRELGASSDYAEGVAAFAAKRAPRFTGS